MVGLTVECRNLLKTFGGLRAVADVTTTFAPGTITALVGPNGAGKTTLLHLLGGSLVPDAGEIWAGGHRIDGLPPWKIARRGIGRLFQDVRIFPCLTALDNVRVAFSGQWGEDPRWALFRRRRVAAQERELTEFARRWLVEIGFHGPEEARAEDLSYGQQKLLALARLLAAEATVLLLDEPTAGLAPELVRNLLPVLRRLAQDGRTVVLIEHNMNVVMQVADRVGFMNRGQLVACGLPTEVLEDDKVRAEYLGL